MRYTQVKRSFGFENPEKTAQHCPTCEVAWDKTKETGCWIQPGHPTEPGVMAYYSWFTQG